MKKNLQIDKLQFIDFPHKISREVYNQNKIRVLDYFRNHSSVKAIYEMGSIGDPGISDLDLILVLKENGTFTNTDYHFLAGLDKDIFVHHPFVIPETLFPYIQYMYYASNLSKLWGAKYKFNTPESNFKNQLDWIICTEAAVYRRCFLNLTPSNIILC